MLCICIVFFFGFVLCRLDMSGDKRKYSFINISNNYLISFFLKDIVPLVFMLKINLEYEVVFSLDKN